MKILFDLQCCQTGSALGGIGRYSIELFKAILKVNSSHDFYCLLNNSHKLRENLLRAELSGYLEQNKILTFQMPRNVKFYQNNVSFVHAAEILREEAISQIEPDILHISSLFEGFLEDIVTSVGRIFPAERTSVTLYDLIPWNNKEKYLQNQECYNHYFEKIQHLLRAKLLLSISEFSKTEAINTLNISESNIVNISSGADDKFKKISISVDDKQKLYSKFGIFKNFMMYTGSFDQRKNHKTLMEAYSKLPVRLKSNYQLVIVGNSWPGIINDLKKFCESVGLSDADVIFTGRASDNELIMLYNLCKLVVYPSLAEGFGLPLVEGMRCGAPVICSNVTSLPEVIGRHDATFDPVCSSSIAETMCKFLESEDALNSLKSHCEMQYKKFTWENSANLTLSAFEECFN